MIEGYAAKEHGSDGHRDGPCQWDVACSGLKHTSHIHQYALSEDGREAIKGAADANEERLLLLVEGEHVETVGGNVVCGGCKGRYHEEDEREGEEAYGRLGGRNDIGIGMGNGECEQYEGCTHQDLHHDNPPPLGAQYVYKGAPQGFYHPRQVDKAGEESHLSVGYAHACEQNHGDVVHNEVRDALCKVECGYP